jgi:hypothetical protein
VDASDSPKMLDEYHLFIIPDGWLVLISAEINTYQRDHILRRKTSA